MQYVPVTIAAGITGKVTKVRLREALRKDPDTVAFRVESYFHGSGDLITPTQAEQRGWSLEVHSTEGSSVAMVEFNIDRETKQLQVVVR